MADHKHDTSGGYEKRDVHVSRVAMLTVFGLGFLGLTGYLVSYFYFKHLAAEVTENPPPLYQADQLPPEPRLQQTTARDLTDLRFAEEKRLSTYGWVDRDNGVVRIPVERAMELVAHRGLPQRPDVKEEAVVAAGQAPGAAKPAAGTTGKQQP